MAISSLVSSYVCVPKNYVVALDEPNTDTASYVEKPSPCAPRQKY
jgi:hypothetical protein